MFAGGNTKDRIEAFLSGFELLKDEKEKFTIRLNFFLENNYGIREDGRGWSGQIEDYSKKEELEWVSGFMRIGIEKIIKELNNEETLEYKSIIRDQVIMMLRYLKNDEFNLNSDWIDRWLGLVNFKQMWFIKLWDSKENKIIEQIDNEIKKINILEYNNQRNTVDLKILLSQFNNLNAL